MWRNFVRGLLVRIWIVRRPDLAARVMERHPAPEELPPGVLVVVQDGDRQKWACFRCPGGCGAELQLSLHPTRRPRSAVGLDWLYRPTLSPSVHQQNACRCHFWVKRGAVEWCADTGTRNKD